MKDTAGVLAFLREGSNDCLEGGALWVKAHDRLRRRRANGSALL